VTGKPQLHYQLKFEKSADSRRISPYLTHVIGFLAILGHTAPVGIENVGKLVIEGSLQAARHRLAVDSFACRVRS
jgi:hypothetical protein